MRARVDPEGPRPWLLLPFVLALAGCAPEEPVIQEPELITLDSPFNYPKNLWNEGVEGETVVMVRVTETGGVDSVYVAESSGMPAFDSAAVVGARDLRFTPGRRDDQRATMWARLPVRFEMNDTIPSEEGSP